MRIARGLLVLTLIALGAPGVAVAQVTDLPVLSEDDRRHGRNRLTARTQARRRLGCRS
jgi:hypothetical protein